VAEVPITDCMKSGRKRIAPNMPRPVISSETEETATIGFLKSDRGISGSTARDSA
jgi:hypothetical protein